MSTIEERAKEFSQPFLDSGYPAISVAAVCGNAWLESGLKPINPSRDGSDGALQWRNAVDVQRLSNMQKWCADNGMDWHTLTSQAKFTIYELGSDTAFSGLDIMLRSPGNRTVDNLTLNFCDIFERPSASGRAPVERIRYANEVLAWLPGASPMAPPKPSIPLPTPTQGAPILPPAVIELIIQIAGPIALNLAHGLAQGLMSAIVQHAGAMEPVGTVSKSAPPAPAAPAPSLDAATIAALIVKEIQSTINPTPAK